MTGEGRGEGKGKGEAVDEAVDDSKGKVVDEGEDGAAKKRTRAIGDGVDEAVDGCKDAVRQRSRGWSLDSGAIEGEKLR